MSAARPPSPESSISLSLPRSLSSRTPMVVNQSGWMPVRATQIEWHAKER
jgi:hypothetical protein